MIIRDRYHSPIYRSIRGIVSFFLRCRYRVRVIGKENIPRSGPVVVGSNHIHNLDPLLVGVETPRYVYFMAKQELFKNKLFGALLRYLGAFPIRRGEGDKQALRNALKVSEHNGCIVVFPEGHRSKDGSLQKGLPGIAFIARKSNCPVVPAAVIGPYKPFARLTLRFGTPFIPGKDATNESVLDELMNRIQSLLDEGHA